MCVNRASQYHYLVVVIIFLPDPPILQDNILVRLVEDGSAIAVNLSKGLAPFPQPSFNWTKDGRLLSSPALTYSSVTFDSIRRVDAGIYNVSATNFVLNSTDQVGSDTGSFYLDVLCELCCLYILKPIIM